MSPSEMLEGCLEAQLVGMGQNCAKKPSQHPQ